MMKPKQITPFQYVFSIWGLVLLLIVSPCKVRNFIQEELGFPKTEVSNKSQTTLKNVSCHSFDNQTLDFKSKKSESTKKLSFSNFSYPVVWDIQKATGPLSKIKEIDYQITPPKPYYILYQNFKDYLI